MRARLIHFQAAALIALLTWSGCAVRGVPIDLTTVAPPEIKLPNKEGSGKFAVVGDTGTGGPAQYMVAARMAAAHSKYPFEWVLMTGDNMYGEQMEEDYEYKFTIPYKPLLDAGVKFYATLGNHDDPNQAMFKPFNMDGKRFYSFRPKLDVRFFAIDSNYLSPEQLQWLEKELAASDSKWKIAFFHHPLYSAGRHGSNIKLREVLEPLFVKHGIDVVFVGHEHFYERVKPQKGIYHFTIGGGAKLRRGDIDRNTEFHAAGFDTGYHFVLFEVIGDELHFQAISEEGQTIDAGVIQRPADPGR